jgi:hypothetical protein
MMLGYADLFWKDNNLYRLGSKRVMLSIVPDAKYPDIYRVVRPDGSLSSMANRTRAKDAGGHGTPRFKWPNEPRGARCGAFGWGGRLMAPKVARVPQAPWA